MAHCRWSVGTAPPYIGPEGRHSCSGSLSPGTRAAEAIPDLSFVTVPLSRRWARGFVTAPEASREPPATLGTCSVFEEEHGRAPHARHGGALDETWVHEWRRGRGDGACSRTRGGPAGALSRGKAAAGRQGDGPECQGDEKELARAQEGVISKQWLKD